MSTGVSRSTTSRHRPKLLQIRNLQSTNSLKLFAPPLTCQSSSASTSPKRSTPDLRPPLLSRASPLPTDALLPARAKALGLVHERPPTRHLRSRSNTSALIYEPRRSTNVPEPQLPSSDRGHYGSDEQQLIMMTSSSSCSSSCDHLPGEDHQTGDDLGALTDEMGAWLNSLAESSSKARARHLAGLSGMGTSLIPSSSSSSFAFSDPQKPIRFRQTRFDHHGEWVMFRVG